MSYLVIFHTFSGVMALERYMKKNNIVCETMPAPRELSVDCGVALRFESEKYENIIEEVSTENIHRIYDINDTYHLIFEND